MRFSIWILGLSSLCFCAGCGGDRDKDYAHKVENPDSPEAVYAKEVRNRLNEMKQALQKEGPGSIDTIGYIEGMEGYGEQPPVGAHGATYEKIHAGVKEIAGMVKSGKSKAEIGKKIDELLGLTKDLPGAAEPEPASK
jgi:hypothetical protein